MVKVNTDLKDGLGILLAMSFRAASDYVPFVDQLESGADIIPDKVVIPFFNPFLFCNTPLPINVVPVMFPTLLIRPLGFVAQ